MGVEQGRMVLPSMSSPTICMAVFSPAPLSGTAITSAWERMRWALMVSSSGSPGPTPTP